MYTKPIEVRGINNGYHYFIDSNHPLATGNSGRVYLHRHIASLKLGKWLSSEEQVHHIDGNKLNNSECNLEVLSARDHAIRHKGVVCPKVCPTCSILFIPRQNSAIYCCRGCCVSYGIKNKDITKEQLDQLIPITSWVALGKLFGYTDNGIKERARALGCEIPKRNKRAKC